VERGVVNPRRRVPVSVFCSPTSFASISTFEIKHCIASLSPSEQNEVSAFLFHLRRASDSQYRERVSSRLADNDLSHWLTLEQFERQLDQK
jgi:hypothetical protein